MSPESYAVEELTPIEAMNDYPAVWLTAEELLPELTADQLALVVSIAVDTCHVCHADDRSCQCWNDD